MNNTTKELIIIFLVFLLGIIVHAVVFTFVFTDGMIYHSEKCSAQGCSGDCIEY